MKAINLEEKLTKFDEYWSPRIVAEVNNHQIKVAKSLGSFVWHKHDDSDEMFLVIKGKLIIEFRDRKVTLNPGDLCVVPKGVEHRPVSPEEAHVLLFEPKGLLNAGDTKSDLTADNPEWI